MKASAHARTSPATSKSPVFKKSNFFRRTQTYPRSSAFIRGQNAFCRAAATRLTPMCGWNSIVAMSSRTAFNKCLGATALVALTITLHAAPTPAAKTLIQQYCTGCHNTQLKTAGLVLDPSETDRIPEHPDLWEKVDRKLRTGEMPPAGRPRPDAAAYRAAILDLESALDRAAADNPKPGRVAVHRLNRTEYTNAIRDLLDLDIDVKSLLPADDSNQDGFDNVASTLSISQVLLENYLSAAHSISGLAVGDLTMTPAVETYKYSKLLLQDDRMGGDLPFGSQGGASIRHRFPLDGE